MNNQSINIDGQPGHRLQNQDNVSPAVSTIKMGLDVHQASVVVVAQWDHSTPKSPQRLSADALVGWIKRLKAQGHRIISVYEASGFGFTLHRRLEALGVESYVTTAQILDSRLSGVKTDGAMPTSYACGWIATSKATSAASPWCMCPLPSMSNNAAWAVSASNWCISG